MPLPSRGELLVALRDVACRSPCVPCPPRPARKELGAVRTLLLSVLKGGQPGYERGLAAAGAAKLWVRPGATLLCLSGAFRVSGGRRFGGGMRRGMSRSGGEKSVPAARSEGVGSGFVASLRSANLDRGERRYGGSEAVNCLCISRWNTAKKPPPAGGLMPARVSDCCKNTSCARGQTRSFLGDLGERIASAGRCFCGGWVASLMADNRDLNVLIACPACGNVGP